ncbi:MAG TPA: ABC transporter ATP-binding protein [Thermoclostridium caenicola]|uniref:ABC transporter ATP-binding protein n=1 Tax=Thermoclostridium caenicola TaxID=659425 RepID=UPI002CD87707|nr:ABC transporter ATP-binding protein [Thermoclostridium caenicola]HPO76533.1 ABC transporter ATP-binding protein [Thermoclostridium caenicola]
MEAVLSANNVSYSYVSRYQKVDALKNVTCSFEKGKFYAIMGRSGSGKSTFLSLLAGLDTPTSGEILFEGKSLAEIDRNKYRKYHASVICQSFNLFQLLTVLENVMYPMELQGAKRRDARIKAAELLAEVGLDESKHNKFPQMLSGGEQQRVAIARALAAGGKILLADEPTGNLDTANERIVVNLLKALAHEHGYTVVVVTHNHDVAAQADRIYYMKDGVLEYERP